MAQQPIIKPEETADEQPPRKIGYVSTRLESKEPNPGQNPQTPPFVITDWASI